MCKCQESENKPELIELVKAHQIHSDSKACWECSKKENRF